MVHVSLRERTGDLGAGMSLHYGDLDLAQVPKKEKAVVVAGKDKGRTGYVTVGFASQPLLCFLFLFFF